MNKISIKKITCFIIVFMIMLVPVISFSAGGQLRSPCGHVGEKMCTFSDFISLINTAITFVLFKIATPFIILILLYAGFLLITSAGNPESLSKAKKMITNVIFGYAIALIAWLFITWILKIFGFTDTTFIDY